MIIQLPRQYDLVDRLLSSNQAIVNEGRERATVFQLFKNDGNKKTHETYINLTLFYNRWNHIQTLVQRVCLI